MTMAQPRPFPLFSRILHWTMAAMILAMLFIGIGMIASLPDYHWLISIHKPLGHPGEPFCRECWPPIVLWMVFLVS